MTPSDTLAAPATAPTKTVPTQAERFFFDHAGYLVLENFLAPDHVARLRAALDQALARRRQDTDPARARLIAKNGESTRIFYILDEGPLFLELLDWAPLMPYVRAFINEKPHHHGSDAFIDRGSDFMDRKGGWHIDGHDNGYRNLGRPIPMLQLKVGYYLSDMTQPGNGNLAFVPGSHKALLDPVPEDLERRELLPGAVQICAPAGSAILFHNALWHAGTPYASPQHGRTMLYYAYEHPWMIGSQEHWGYSKDFYNRRLSAEQRKFFHGFLFDPVEQRWG